MPITGYRSPFVGPEVVGIVQSGAIAVARLVGAAPQP
jgi:hypothetical protein